MKYAPQVEDFFMGKDAFSFICESSEDYNTFASEVQFDCSHPLVYFSIIYSIYDRSAIS